MRSFTVSGRFHVSFYRLWRIPGSVLPSLGNSLQRFTVSGEQMREIAAKKFERRRFAELNRPREYLKRL